jgi:hypothetical protein
MVDQDETSADRCWLCREPFHPGEWQLRTDDGSAHVKCYEDRQEPSLKPFS